MVEFGELKGVDLRQAWPHEANNFTPWLAENLDKLSQVIGIPMELVQTEMSVEQFSADIVARSLDGSLVLIENQLEWTNHTHLGQVLTYLAGTEAHTIIWIAREFTNPHLSAIRWLNAHTVDPYDFFAVRVKVVQIGDSPLAPLFEILERPNNWDQKVRIQSENRELSGFPKLCHDFWEFYRERHPDDLTLREGFRGHTFSFSIGDVRAFIFLQPSVSNVGIYIRPRNSSAEAAQSRDRCWYALQERGRDSDWPATLPVNINEREKWDEAAAFIHDTLPFYREVLELERDGKLESLDIIQPPDPQS